MLDKIKRRLLLFNILAFTGALTAFSVGVYGYCQQSLDSQIREHLSSMVSASLSSIDRDDIGGVPDALEEPVFENTTHPMYAELQWFDLYGQLVTQRGTFPMQAPLHPDQEFEEVRNPHALVLTRAVWIKNRLYGYMRGIQPLDSRDRVMNQLFVGLCFGIVGGAAVSVLGIQFLVGQSIQPIADVLSKLKQFTADASHELINPVTVVKSNSAVALKYPEGMRESDKERMLAIQSAGEQMSTLIVSLLQMARLDEAGFVAPEELSVIDVAQLCDCMAHARQRAKESVTLEVSMVPGMNVRARKADLQSLYGNIIGNAFDYTPDGGLVMVTGSTDDANVIVSVSDTGVGIESANYEHIFDRFWRAEKARTRREGGSGLGLAIAKSIAEKYRGTISVKSELGKGSTFEIRLPKA